MAKQKTIKITGANFSGHKLRIKSSVLTIVTITAPFDQLLASVLGIKEQIYDGNGGLPEDFDGWQGRQEYLGARLTLAATQGRIETGKIAEPITLGSLKVDSFAVKRHKDSEALRITFQGTLDDSNAHLHQLIHGMKRDTFDCIITPASKAEAEAASNQLSLLKGKPEAEDEDEGGVEE